MVAADPQRGVDVAPGLVRGHDGLGRGSVGRSDIEVCLRRGGAFRRIDGPAGDRQGRAGGRDRDVGAVKGSLGRVPGGTDGDGGGRIADVVDGHGGPGVRGERLAGLPGLGVAVIAVERRGPGVRREQDRGVAPALLGDLYAAVSVSGDDGVVAHRRAQLQEVDLTGFRVREFGRPVRSGAGPGLEGRSPRGGDGPQVRDFLAGAEASHFPEAGTDFRHHVPVRDPHQVQVVAVGLDGTGGVGEAGEGPGRDILRAAAAQQAIGVVQPQGVAEFMGEDGNGEAAVLRHEDPSADAAVAVGHAGRAVAQVSARDEHHQGRVRTLRPAEFLGNKVHDLRRRLGGFSR